MLCKLRVSVFTKQSYFVTYYKKQKKQKNKRKRLREQVSVFAGQQIPAKPANGEVVVGWPPTTSNQSKELLFLSQTLYEYM